MDTLDIRYSLRLLRNSPLFTLSAVLALALGIGANTAVFSVVNALLLRPLAYRDPSQIVVALHDGRLPVSPADFQDYRKSVTTLDGLGAAQGWSGNITGQDKPETVTGVQVTANLFPMLGIEPQIGRLFRASEDQPGAERTLILSNALWQRDFGARRDVLGRRISIDGVPYTIIAVMPQGFQFPPFWFTGAEMWAPLDLSNRKADRGGRSLRLFGRLKPGVSLQSAQSEMSTIARRLASEYPNTNTGLDIAVQPLREKVVQSIRPTLLVLLGTVALVLLIASVNVANLLLARASARRREMAVRVAIGASRSQIVRQLLTESTVLAVLGGMAGLLVSVWAIDVLKTTMPPGSLPRQQELGIDTAVLFFTMAVSVTTGIVAGLIPAMQFSRADVNEDLKSGSKGTSASSGTGRARSVLVIAEVALGLILLAGAGLMLRTFAHLSNVDPGFNPHALLTFEVSVAGTPHDKPGNRALLFERVRDQLSAVPGVQAVSAINHLPLAGDIWRLGFAVEGRPAPPPGTDQSAVYRVVMPKYFEAMQLRLLRGRDFTEHDNAQAPPAVIINNTMARHFWPSEDPLGKIITMGGSGPDAVRLTIVGVAADAKQDDWTKPPHDEVYLAYLQRPDSMGLKYLTFVARTAAQPDGVLVSAQQAIWSVDRNLPVSRIRTMDHVISNELWRARIATVLLGCFGSIALVLAALGIYGVISYQVARRTQEIGIRMALGADSLRVIRLALYEGMQPVMAGAIIGIAGAFVATRWMESLLYHVKPSDPLTLAAVTACLLFVGLLANLIPALRASRLNPVSALRHE